MWGTGYGGYYGNGYYDGYGSYGWGGYGSQIILVVVILIIGCLFLACVVGGLWLVYSRQQKDRRTTNVEYYPQYYPRSGGTFTPKDASSTEFR